MPPLESRLPASGERADHEAAAQGTADPECVTHAADTLKSMSDAPWRELRRVLALIDESLHRLTGRKMPPPSM